MLAMSGLPLFLHLKGWNYFSASYFKDYPHPFFFSKTHRVVNEMHTNLVHFQTIKTKNKTEKTKSVEFTGTE